jgi:FAD/FMN-containing dehydrogenase
VSAPLSWNRVPRVAPRRVAKLGFRHEGLPALAGAPHRLAYGMGRSYGDVCLNEGGLMMRTRGLDRLIAFDRATGRLSAEAGVTLDELIAFGLPQGFFPPVTPGTRFVTLGGAVANDVHGKNHHDAGTFGHWVRELEILRSDGERIVCGPNLRPDWFSATVGGLGLTGLITRVELELARVANPFLVTEGKRFRTLDEFFALNAQAERDWPYTAAWIDCLSANGRGIQLAARHAPAQAHLPALKARRLSFPLDPPVSLVNALSLKAFNAAYYRQPLPRGPTLGPYEPYLYPLDKILNWNRIYGRRGFYQYQCVLPPQAAREGVALMLKRIAAAREGSFLAVLKTFGAKPSLGMLSFARPGATLALDFPNHGEPTKKLFAELDAVVAEHGGALYPAKDARMPGWLFRQGFPEWERFSAYVDPEFSSSFWRRVLEL